MNNTRDAEGSPSYSFTASAAGTYLWVASYGGDGINLAATTQCGNEPVLVTKAVTSLSARPSRPLLRSAAA